LSCKRLSSRHRKDQTETASPPVLPRAMNGSSLRSLTALAWT
jgi:hypothetical protein